MGLLLHTWSEDTFRRIANGMDGKLVRPIHNWLTVKCNEVEFETYVKEFGAKVLSRHVQSLNKTDESFVQELPETMSSPVSQAREMERSVQEDEDDGVHVEDILVPVQGVNATLNSVLGGMREEENGGMIGNDVSGARIEDDIKSQGLKVLDSGLDHHNSLRAQRYNVAQDMSHIGMIDLGLSLLFAEGENNRQENISSDIFPYPPSFEPCGNGAHVHRRS
ncbi:hypothetical protein PIB30_047503 [Stylosanthes scabra]|uniref:Uncharacterized protein n=1 Tax=Stylosanthes scabra TaxID=79078 RepID=A0ABU6UG36_9FABA|nr:hypothetical protein [Stylosanthes scabra]